MKNMMKFAAAAVAAMALTAAHGRTIVYIGDSITDGNWGGVTGAPASDQRHLSDMNHIFGHGYMSICASALMAERPGEYECHNRGIGGQSLTDLAERWDKDVVALKPDVLSVLIGTNDAEQWLAGGNKLGDVDEWTQMYDSLLTVTRRRLPEVEFVLCTPFVAKAGWAGSALNYDERLSMIRELDAAVISLARKHGAKVVPFDVLFAGLQPAAPAADYWIWDGIHPTPAGHKKMADLWLEVTGELLK